MPIPSPRTDVTVGKHAGKPRKHRISVKVRDAVRLMTEQALSRADAAKAVGLTDHSLYVALKKPQVIEFMRECMADLRKSAAARALGEVARLSTGAASEHVRLNASQFLLGIEGVRPVERVEHDHTVRVMPGYVLDPSGPDLRRPEQLRDVSPIIDGEGREVDQGKRSPQSVQHAASDDDARPQDVGGRGTDSDGD